MEDMDKGYLRELIQLASDACAHGGGWRVEYAEDFDLLVLLDVEAANLQKSLLWLGDQAAGLSAVATGQLIIGDDPKQMVMLLRLTFSGEHARRIICEAVKWHADIAEMKQRHLDRGLLMEDQEEAA